MIKNKTCALITILCLSWSIFEYSIDGVNAQEITTSQAKPIILLKKMTPELYYGTTTTTIWQLNWKNPAFVLYDDGLVIFRKKTDDFNFFSVKLPPDEMNKLLDEFGVNEQFINLEEHYNINDDSDPPINTIATWQDQKEKSVTVVGHLNDDKEDDRKKTSPTFLKLFDQLNSFEHFQAQNWQPQSVRILITAFPGSQGEPATWPQGWPDLMDQATQKITSDSYAIYLNGESLHEFEQLMANLKENQAVLINEKRWYISPERYCLPGEESWAQR